MITGSLRHLFSNRPVRHLVVAAVSCLALAATVPAAEPEGLSWHPVFMWMMDPIPGDLDMDGRVDAYDLEILLSLWGHFGSVADINGDEIVDAYDLAILLRYWTG